MPVYIIHGFKWDRNYVNIFTITRRLDDATQNWLMGKRTHAVFLKQFHKEFPAEMALLPNLRFIEEYDQDQVIHAGPFAFVADSVQEIKGCIDLNDAQVKFIPQEQYAAISSLRDKLFKGQQWPAPALSHYIVRCDDEERLASDDEGEDNRNLVESNATSLDLPAAQPSAPPPSRARGKSFSRGIKNLFRSKESAQRAELKKAASLKDLKQPRAMTSSRSTVAMSSGTASSSPPPPPMPPVGQQYKGHIAQMRERSAASWGEAQRPQTAGGALAQGGGGGGSGAPPPGVGMAR